MPEINPDRDNRGRHLTVSAETSIHYIPLFSLTKKKDGA
jgi:hypothetical protein